MNRREFLGAAGAFVALVAARPLKTLSELTPVAAPAGLPVGSVTMLAECPVGYLPCDGRAISAADYPALHAVLGRTYGGGGRWFRVPDFRGFVGTLSRTSSRAEALPTLYLIRAT